MEVTTQTIEILNMAKAGFDKRNEMIKWLISSGLSVYVDSTADVIHASNKPLEISDE